MTIADALEMPNSIKHDLQKICGQFISKEMSIARLSLFNVLTRTTFVTDKRLIIDIQTFKNYFCNKILDIIAFILSQHNNSDSPTKIKNRHILMKVLQERKLCYPVQL